MSYTKTNWKAGDTVTSTKLNKIEQGIANAATTPKILVVQATESEAENNKTKLTLNKTWNEIRAFNGLILIQWVTSDYTAVKWMPVTEINNEGTKMIYALKGNSVIEFVEGVNDYSWTII